MKYATVQKALIQAWIDADFGLTTFYPDRNYDPTTEHARLFFLPVDNVPATMGADGTNDISVIMQADIMYSTGRGNGELLEMVDTVCAAFTSGTRFTADNQQVVCWGAQLSSIVTDGGWLKAVVSINASAYVRRQS